jgi:iron complex transport system substrate-binding protein
MRVVSLDPQFTELFMSLSVGRELVGVTHRCSVNSPVAEPAVVTTEKMPSGISADEARLLAGLSEFPVDLKLLQDCLPKGIITTVREENVEEFCLWAEAYLEKAIKRKVMIFHLEINSLGDMLDACETLGKKVGRAREGRDLGHRIKAQLMDWGRNLYGRLRNKKVTVLTQVSPPRVAGKWIPDAIKLVSGRPQFSNVRSMSKETTWAEIAAFAPDVIVVAPEVGTVEESVRTLRYLETLPEWETIPAVNRGEVVFAEGKNLYSPGVRFLKGASILISGMAGLESGYVSGRDDFYRLRFVELHRHRFL